MNTFEIKKDAFYYNDEKLQIISGAIHYFRVVPEYWRDRLEKLIAMGCNTVETYVAWNMHEPKKGEFHFDGMLDMKKFILLAQEMGLHVIVRPSPYICAEWEFGGLPAWLLKEDGMKLRCTYEPYLKHVREYYEELFKILVPLQVTHGGPVIMMQIENEYGYYGDDQNYMEYMKNLMIELGVDVPMMTSDGPFDESFINGKVEGILQTGNFGSDTKGRFEFMRKYVDGPLMCAEFWIGWFDNWGCGKHNRGEIEKNKVDFEGMVRDGNVNIYMFEGGTNFGFMNGSNYYDNLTPDVTSYDYDALLTEDGQITEKYTAFQDILRKYKEIPEVQLSTKISRKAYGKVTIDEKVSLFATLDTISEKVSSLYPVSMEKLDQSYGYILYQSILTRQNKLEKVRLVDANDRAVMYLNNQHVTTLYDLELLQEKELETPVPVQSGDTFSILMENMGRVNFGPRMEHQRKGIDGEILVNGHHHFYWDMYCLPLDNTEKIDFSKEYVEGTPAFYKGTLTVDETADTFLDMEGWGKGCVFLNGFNIGRFWEIGPQKRLYIPGPLLKKGENEIIIFETEGKCVDFVESKDEPDIG